MGIKNELAELFVSGPSKSLRRALFNDASHIPGPVGLEKSKLIPASDFPGMASSLPGAGDDAKEALRIKIKHSALLDPKPSFELVAALSHPDAIARALKERGYEGILEGKLAGVPRVERAKLLRESITPGNAQLVKGSKIGNFMLPIPETWQGILPEITTQRVVSMTSKYAPIVGFRGRGGYRDAAIAVARGKEFGVPKGVQHALKAQWEGQPLMEMAETEYAYENAINHQIGVQSDLARLIRHANKDVGLLKDTKHQLDIAEAATFRQRHNYQGKVMDMFQNVPRDDVKDELAKKRLKDPIPEEFWKA